MQRDVKVGLVLGVLLVAIVAVVFFRRDDQEREKFAKLLPAPDAVASRARDALASPSDPYPVPPEYVGEAWQSPSASKPARTPAPPRVKQAEPAAAEKSKPAAPAGGSSVVLQPPQFDRPKAAAASKSDRVTSLNKPVAGDAGSRHRASGEYTIQPYDTLSGIAQRQLGDSSLYPLIYDANRDLIPDPDHLEPGKRIRIPELHRTDRRRAAAANATAPAAQPPRLDTRRAAGSVYEVQPNDTLFEIARKIYRDESMYRAIFEANRDQLITPDDLQEGMVLQLPQK